MTDEVRKVRLVRGPFIVEFVPELSGRMIVYTNQVPLETDILNTNRYQMVNVGQLITTLLGTGIGNTNLVCRLACNPISPPGLAVTVGSGVLYHYGVIDQTDYGVLPADTNPNHDIFKQYINQDPVTLNTPAPLVTGNSIIYLVQVAGVESDVNNVSRPYYNSADPAVPIFASNYDTRLDSVSITIKAGTEAPSPTPPTPDAGYIALYYVQVAYGQTTIISGNITVVPGAPFITESLTQKISSGYVNDNFVSIVNQQSSTYIYGDDVGSANALVFSPTKAYASYVPGTIVNVKVAFTNTGAATINVSGLGVINIVDLHNNVLSAGDLVAGTIAVLQYDGTNFQLLNTASIAKTSITNTFSTYQNIPVAFSQVSLSGNQNIPDNANNLIIHFNNVIYDPLSWFNPSTYQFTPTIAGWYELLAQIHWGGGGSTGTQFVNFMQNSSTILGHTSEFNDAPFSQSATSSSQLIYFNGSTDYAWLSVGQNVNASLTLQSSMFQIKFVGV